MASTHNEMTVEATPEGWQMFTLENWVRCVSYLVRRFTGGQADMEPEKRIKVVKVEMSYEGIKAHLQVPKDRANEVQADNLSEELKALADLPLSPCACGCMVDLSVTTCKRDAINETLGKAEPTDDERKLAKSGTKGAKTKAIKAMMARTGLPVKDCTDALAG